MASRPRVVAELGRPETPDETAARKAAASRTYRSSQTFRNLIAALLVTVAVVAVIVFAVPRGSFTEPEPIDVASEAAEVSATLNRTVVVPDVPQEWRVNRAAVVAEDLPAWTLVYAPDTGTGFVNVAQGFDADEAWPSRVLGGTAATGTETIGGIEWDRYDIGDPARAGNVSFGLATAAGSDVVLIYGKTDDDTARQVAAGLADQIRALREEAP